jgi:hypothetical protein
VNWEEDLEKRMVDPAFKEYFMQKFGLPKDTPGLPKPIEPPEAAKRSGDGE